MRVDEGMLRAYLDGELSPSAHDWVERALADSPEAQATLAQLRQAKEQINQRLATLAPSGAATSSAVVMFKRLQAQLEATFSSDGSPAKSASLTVWESPSLLAEIKSNVKKIRYHWRQAVTKGFMFATIASLIIVISAIALAVWPEMGHQLAEQIQQVAPSEIGKLPATETKDIQTAPVVAASSLPFGYGIQADPLGDAEANISHVKTLGFDWVKLQMDWKQVEPAAGDYDWASWDKVIDAYAAAGVNIMLAVVKAPDWARPSDDDKSIEGLPADPAKYAEFVAQIADRYRGKVQAIEVWNEQNLWYKTGGKGKMDAAKYVQLLQLSYQAIKAVNQEMIVISGAISPAGDVGDMAIDDIEYLRQMYVNGVKGSFDALGATPWGYNCPALADWRTVTTEEAGADSHHGTFTNRHHSWCFLGTMGAYREVMLANGDGDKPIAITGFGWAVSDYAQPGHEFARDNTPEEQAQWSVAAYQWGKKQGWVGPMILWNLDYSVTAPDAAELAMYSILNTSAYEALVKMPK
jgi:hypothetical protein